MVIRKLKGCEKTSRCLNVSFITSRTFVHWHSLISRKQSGTGNVLNNKCRVRRWIIISLLSGWRKILLLFLKVLSKSTLPLPAVDNLGKFLYFFFFNKMRILSYSYPKGRKYLILFDLFKCWKLQKLCVCACVCVCVCVFIHTSRHQARPIEMLVKSQNLNLLHPHYPCSWISAHYLNAQLTMTLVFRGFPGGSVVKNGPANAGDADSIPGPRRSSREGNSNPLQYFCLGNSMDRGIWWATVHGVAKTWTWLSIRIHSVFMRRTWKIVDLSTHTHIPVLVFILKHDLIITIRKKIPALRVEMSNYFIIFWMVFPFLTIFQK